MKNGVCGFLVMGWLSMAFLADGKVCADAVPEGQTQLPVHFSATAIPLRYAYVNGDSEKFKALQWREPGYVVGARDIVLDCNVRDIHISAEGSGEIGEGDYSLAGTIEKENFGYVHADFKQFRKYYENTGGVYAPFSVFNAMRLDHELALDVGDFLIDAVFKKEKYPELGFEFKHSYQEGSRSRLTWGSAREGGVIRKIVPSWQKIDKQVNQFTVKASHTFKGFEFKGDQRWEFGQSRTERYEKNVATSTLINNLDTKIRIQQSEPDHRMASTTANVARWFLKEKVFSSLTYHVVRINNNEDATLREFDEFMNPQSYTNSENHFNASADNQMDNHTAAWNLTTIPWSWLQMGSKMKMELSQRIGSSYYPSITTDPPDETPSRVEISGAENKVRGFAESFNLRFKGIPRTALYSEVEFEQIRNWIAEDRASVGATPGANPSASAYDRWNRETLVMRPRSTWTFGGDILPIRRVNLSSQFRLKQNKNQYRNIVKNPGVSDLYALSGFFNENDVKGAEFNSRLTLKPCDFVQPSLRYQWNHQRTHARVLDEEDIVTDDRFHTATIDLLVFPLDDLTLDGSFSREAAYTDSPTNRTAQFMEDYRSIVNTWQLSADYGAWQHLSLDSSFFYSRADNFDEAFLDTSLPLGSDYTQVGITAGLTWKVRSNISLSPKYLYSRYHTHPNAGVGNFDAHAFLIEVTITWG